MPELTIGVLALQGAFIEHINLLQRAASHLQKQQDSREQKPSDLQDIPSASEAESGNAASATSPFPPSGQRNPDHIDPQADLSPTPSLSFTFITVRTPLELTRCTALIIPGGESTAISLIASRTGLLDPLRDFVKAQRKPVWGTCAGLILLAERADRTKETGQELIGGLDVCVRRNYFGRQVESFEAELDLPFLGPGAGRFHSVFIRAPVVTEVFPASSSSSNGGTAAVGTEGSISAPAIKSTTAPVEVLARLPGRARTIKDRTTTAGELGEEGDIVAVRQGNVFGTAFHPELTGDERIHAWWLREVVRLVEGGDEGV